MIRLICLFIVLLFCNSINSQSFHGKYQNECEYIDFLNDSLLKYSVYIPINQKVVARYCGYGVYYKNDSNLIVRHVDLEIDSIKPIEYCSICFIDKEEIHRYIYKYTNRSIFLKGPILMKYEKYNKLSIRRLLLPWRKHWYDPIERELTNN